MKYAIIVTIIAFIVFGIAIFLMGDYYASKKEKIVVRRREGGGR